MLVTNTMDESVSNIILGDRHVNVIISVLQLPDGL